MTDERCAYPGLARIFWIGLVLFLLAAAAIEAIYLVTDPLPTIGMAGDLREAFVLRTSVYGAAGGTALVGLLAASISGAAIVASRGRYPHDARATPFVRIAIPSAILLLVVGMCAVPVFIGTVDYFIRSNRQAKARAQSVAMEKERAREDAKVARDRWRQEDLLIEQAHKIAAGLCVPISDSESCRQKLKLIASTCTDLRILEKMPAQEKRRVVATLCEQRGQLLPAPDAYSNLMSICYKLDPERAEIIRRDWTDNEVEYIDPHSSSAYYWAGDLIYQKRFETLRRLLERGFDPTVKPNGRIAATPLIIWALRTDVDALKLLLAHGLPADEPLSLKTPEPPPMVKIASGRRRPARPADFSALEYLVEDYSQRLGHIRVLLAAGANPNRRNGNNQTPLHIAVLHRAPELVKLLLEYKADVNAPDGDASTPLDLTDSLNEPAQTTVAKILKDHGGKRRSELPPATPAIK